MKTRPPLFQLCLIAIICVGTFAVRSQQNERVSAKQAFQSGDYSKTASLVKNLLKSNDRDAELWQILAAAQYKQRKYKDSIKSYQKAVEIEPANDSNIAALAYVYLTVRNKQAYKTASDALTINQQNAEAHYVLGVLSYRDEMYVAAYDRARRVIQLNPDMAAPYRLKSQALLASFLALNGKVLPPGSRGDLLVEAVADLEKFFALSTDPAIKINIQYELDTLNYFAKYYSRPENRLVRDVTAIEPPDPTATPLKILRKPKPSYTDSARQRSVQGTIKLLVAFDASGRVGPILVTRSLDDDLDREAVMAARGISFNPPTKNGVPFSVVKQVEYSFSIY